jgi:hypothetical protein
MRTAVCTPKRHPNHLAGRTLVDTPLVRQQLDDAQAPSAPLVAIGRDDRHRDVGVFDLEQQRIFVPCFEAAAAIGVLNDVGDKFRSGQCDVLGEGTVFAEHRGDGLAGRGWGAKVVTEVERYVGREFLRIASHDDVYPAAQQSERNACGELSLVLTGPTG